MYNAGMPTVQIRELPEPVYQKLRETAEFEHRSLSQQAVVLPARALEVREFPKQRRQRLLQRLAEKPLVESTVAMPSPEDLVREDRNR